MLKERSEQEIQPPLRGETYLRKQIPLCAYHHDLLHSGDLNYADMTKIKRYT